MGKGSPRGVPETQMVSELLQGDAVADSAAQDERLRVVETGKEPRPGDGAGERPQGGIRG